MRYDLTLVDRRRRREEKEKKKKRERENDDDDDCGEVKERTLARQRGAR